MGNEGVCPAHYPLFVDGGGGGGVGVIGAEFGRGRAINDALSLMLLRIVVLDSAGGGANAGGTAVVACKNFGNMLEISHCKIKHSSS